MEFNVETISSILGLILGGGGIGWFFTWKYTRRKEKAEAESAEAAAVKELQDIYQQMMADVKADRDEQKAYIRELKEDARRLRDERNELSDRLDKMEEEQRAMKMEIARNGRQIEAMRPFMCGDLACKKRQRVTITDEGEVDDSKTK